MKQQPFLHRLASNIDDGSMTNNDSHLLVDNDDDESDDDDFDHEEADSYDDESVVEDRKMERQLIKEQISREELDALSVSSNDDGDDDDGSNTSGADNSSMTCSNEDNNNYNTDSRVIRRSKRKRFDFSNKITSGDDDDTSNEVPSLDIGTLDVANIVHGKRRRTQIDYRK
jgi:hypothetical protein